MTNPRRGVRPNVLVRPVLCAFLLAFPTGCRPGAPGEGPQPSAGPVAGPEEARRPEAGDPRPANVPEPREAGLERGAGDLLPRPAVLVEYQRFAREAISGERAREMVAALDPSYRVPGNEPFNRAIAGVVEALKAAGYQNEGHGEGNPLTYRVERRALSGPTWEPVQASLSLAGATQPLMDLASNVNLVAANSHSTSPGGVEGEVVFVGPGTAEDFEGMAVRGKIVLGDGSVRQLFRRAVQEHGALGVLAYRLPDFNRPEENRAVAPMSSIPYDSVAGSWGLLLSRDARDALVDALETGPTRVRVDLETRIYSSEELTLVAEVRGSSKPEERFVFSAHVQESGANDNLSGVAALSEIARALGEGVRSGFLTPDRTITMLWGDEISSTRRFLEEDTVRAAGVRWGLSLDMVGEDTEETGGTFLIEKMPDPSAVWTRGQDRHTEWGGRPLTSDQLTPHYLNDFVLNRCLDQAAGSGWVVRTNPYEGGSDHVPFLQVGTAGVLFWHFTDQFYHTDGDRLEMVSPSTLWNVGVCAAVSAMVLTTVDAEVAAYLIEEVERSGLARLAAEGELSRATVTGGGDPEKEREILESWTNWYLGALEAMVELEPGGASPETLGAIRGARERLSEVGRAVAASTGGRR